MSRRRRANAEQARLTREFEAIVSARRASGGDSPPPEPGVDVAAVVAAELRRQQQVEAERAEREQWERHRCPTGGCACCGLEAVATAHEDGTLGSGWHPTSEGHVCELCWHDFRGDLFATDDTRRVDVLRWVLGITTIPMRAMAHPQAFAGIRVYWHEHDAAPVATRAERFAHVDRDRLRQEWEATANPRVETVPQYAKREPCPDCGARDKWAEVDESIEQFDGSLHTFRTWRCMRCITKVAWSETGKAIS